MFKNTILKINIVENCVEKPVYIQIQIRYPPNHEGVTRLRNDWSVNKNVKFSYRSHPTRP